MENTSALTVAAIWLSELDQSVADGDITQYRATCDVLKVILAGGQPPEVAQLFEEYIQCPA
jgi:hypothetical protein